MLKVAFIQDECRCINLVIDNLNYLRIDILLAHMVSSDEFIFSDVSMKEKRVAVPGVLYAQRKAILSLLKQNHIQSLNKTFLHKLITILFQLR